MKRLTFILFLTYFLLTTFTHAQETAPWPPDPAQMFTNRVEVVSVEPVEPTIDTRPVVDNDNRLLRIYDEATSQWREYPYPKEIEKTEIIRFRSDGKILLGSRSFDDYYGNKILPTAWLFDPKAGEFSRPDSVCDEQVRDAEGQGEWHFYTNPVSGDTYLCFTENGQLEGPLPKDIGWYNHWEQFGQAPKLSPDRKWLAFRGVGAGTDNTSDHYRFFSYEIATGKLNHLGDIEFDFSGGVAITSWIGNTQGTVIDYPRQDYLAVRYYGFDVTQPNSLEYVFHGFNWSTYYDESTGYEDLDTDFRVRRYTGTTTPEHIPCTLRTYNSTGLHSYEFGYNCLPIATNFDDCVDALRLPDRYIFLRTDSADDRFSTLVVFEKETEQFREIISGEIETILQLSPNGRYIALLTDDDGHLDLIETCGVSRHGLERAMVRILDMESPSFVYHTESYAADSFEFTWIDDDEFVFQLNNGFSPIEIEENDFILGDWFNSSLRLVTIREDGVFARTMYGRPYLPPIGIAEYFSPIRASADRNYLIGRDDRNGIWNIADFVIGNVIPITQPSNDYSVELNWGEDDTLVALVRAQFGRHQPLRYILRLV